LSSAQRDALTAERENPPDAVRLHLSIQLIGILAKIVPIQKIDLNQILI
jgi:hypothetical protein